MSKVRDWAIAQDIPVGARGRLPRTLVVDYLMAHPAEGRAFLKAQHVPVGKRGRISRKAIEGALK